jgi:hypothetical protein
MERQPTTSLQAIQYCDKNRRGSTLVEFAIVAPLLLSIVFLFIEFGRYMMTVQAIEEAARVGCREAILEGTTVEIVEARVEGILTPFGIGEYDLSVEPNLQVALSAGSPITVEISLLYDDVAWLPSPKFLQGKMVSVAATLPKEK